MDTLDYLQQKYNLNLNQHISRMPIEIPNVNRRTLAEWYKELGFTKGVEIGVAGGWYSSHMCKVNPELTLYGVDPYERQPGYLDYQRTSTFSRLEAEAHERLDQYPNYHFLRMTSAEALDNFADGSLDFVYLDGDHCFESVTFDIAAWSKKIRKGGILAGHDYAKHRKQGVKIHVVQAVRGYTEAYRINPWFVLGGAANDGTLIRDRIRSWFWIV